MTRGFKRLASSATFNAEGTLLYHAKEGCTALIIAMRLNTLLIIATLDISLSSMPVGVVIDELENYSMLCPSDHIHIAQTTGSTSNAAITCLLSVCKLASCTIDN